MLTPTRRDAGQGENLRSGDRWMDRYTMETGQCGTPPSAPWHGTHRASAARSSS